MWNLNTKKNIFLVSSIEFNLRERKQKDWKILHELLVEMQKEFSYKTTRLQNQYNSEIRQIYEQSKTDHIKTESEKSMEGWYFVCKRSI